MYAESQGVSVTTLPETLIAHWEILQSNVTSWYGALTGCQYCHSRLVLLSGVSADCASTLESVREKYWSFTRVIASRASPALLCVPRDCGSDDTSAWCDHPNACFGSTECPVWPKEFLVQTVSKPENGSALRTSLVSSARCAPVRSRRHVKVLSLTPGFCCNLASLPLPVKHVVRSCDG